MKKGAEPGGIRVAIKVLKRVETDEPYKSRHAGANVIRNTDPHPDACYAVQRVRVWSK